MLKFTIGILYLNGRILLLRTLRNLMWATCTWRRSDPRQLQGVHSEVVGRVRFQYVAPWKYNSNFKRTYFNLRINIHELLFSHSSVYIFCSFKFQRRKKGYIFPSGRLSLCSFAIFSHFWICLLNSDLVM